MRSKTDVFLFIFVLSSWENIYLLLTVFKAGHLHRFSPPTPNKHFEKKNVIEQLTGSNWHVNQTDMRLYR